MGLELLLVFYSQLVWRAGVRFPCRQEIIGLMATLLMVCFAWLVGDCVACSVCGGHGDRNACRVVFCALALLAEKIVVPGTFS